MAKGYNIDIRKKNKKNLVLNIIKNYNQTSKSKVKTLSKLSMTTVLQCIDDLIKEDLIYEAGIGESTGGRKPVWLEINPNGAFFLGIEFNANGVVGIILNLNGEIVHTSKIVIKEEESVNRMIDIIKGCIHDMLQKLQQPFYKIKGIGIGVPGFIDKEKGMALQYVNIPGWSNIPIRDIIEEEFGITTYIDQNVNAMALAFKWYKYNKGIRNILFISIRTGVGMSFILNNEVYSGRNGVAGEIGHIVVSDNHEKCYCGKYGCLDTEVGYKGIKNKIINGLKMGNFPVINKLIGDDIDNLDIDVFVKAVNQGDKDAVKLLKGACKVIGLATSHAVNILNPDKVIFSGELSTTDNFISYIKKELKDNCLPITAERLMIERSDLGDRVGGIGAACVVMQQEFGFSSLHI